MDPGPCWITRVAWTSHNHRLPPIHGFPYTTTSTFLAFAANGGTSHTSQTILAANAATLICTFDSDGAAWNRPALLTKIVGENIFGKRTESARRGSLRDMVALYGFDDPPPVTRVALALWPSASNHPLLLGLLAVARDPVLRASADVIFAAQPGQAISFRDMASYLHSKYPDRYSPGTLRAVGERCISSWGQMGYLTPGRQRRRTAAAPDVAVSAFAAFLASCAGYAGAAMLASNWFRLLDVSQEQALSLLRRAEATGDVRVRIAGHVIDIDLAGRLATIATAGKVGHGLL